jgi:hypothetical protein
MLVSRNLTNSLGPESMNRKSKPFIVAFVVAPQGVGSLINSS